MFCRAGRVKCPPANARPVKADTRTLVELCNSLIVGKKRSWHGNCYFLAYELEQKDIAMNVSAYRLPLRLAIPVIALIALAVAGEPVSVRDGTGLSAAPVAALELACDDALAHESDTVEATEQRRHTAMRLRWAVTLPDSSRPLSIRVLP